MTHYPAHETVANYLDLFKIHHVYNKRGDHRLESSVTGAISRWAKYSDICTLKIEGRVFAGTTEYWDFELPEVFEVFAIKQHSDAVVETQPKPKLSLAEQLARKKSAGHTKGERL